MAWLSGQCPQEGMALEALRDRQGVSFSSLMSLSRGKLTLEFQKAQ